jgi:carbon storage regulator
LNEGVKMLVVTRQEQEEIVIGDDIVITIVRIHGEKVRIGITAPKELSVYRREVAERIAYEKSQEAW